MLVGDATMLRSNSRVESVDRDKPDPVIRHWAPDTPAVCDFSSHKCLIACAVQNLSSIWPPGKTNFPFMHRSHLRPSVLGEAGVTRRFRPGLPHRERLASSQISARDGSLWTY